MKIPKLNEGENPNEDAYQVSVYKSKIDNNIYYTTGTGQKIQINNSDTPEIRNVYADLTANNTTSSTTSILEYGVNVFTTATSTNNSCKLPQPKTGRSTIIVNNTSSPIKLFPSNVGGKINNYAIDAPAIIPADGKSYTFICTKNPLPGEWTWDAPAIGQYDSGDIIVTVTGGTNGGGHYTPTVSASKASDVGFGQGFVGSNWGYNGKNKPLSYSFSFGDGFAAVFKPGIKWNGISKIKVYTNIINDNGDDSLVRLMASGETDFYDAVTDDFISNGASADNTQLFDFVLNKRISGTNATVGYVSANIGDAETQWGEKVANSDIYSNVSLGANFGTSIGDTDKGLVTYPYSTPVDYVGVQVQANYSSYISFQIRPLPYTNYNTLTDFKFRFIIEYY